MTKIRSASGTRLSNRAGPLRVDGQDRVAAGGQDPPHLLDRRPVPVVVTSACSSRPLAGRGALRTRRRSGSGSDTLSISPSRAPGWWPSRSARPADGVGRARPRSCSCPLPTARETTTSSGFGKVIRLSGSIEIELGTAPPLQSVSPRGRATRPAARRCDDPDLGQARRTGRPAARSSAVSRAHPTGGRAPSRAACRNWRSKAAGTRSAAVAQVAGDRQAQVGKVRADLVGAPVIGWSASSAYPPPVPSSRTR